MWSALDDAERQVYREKAAADKARYDAEMLAYVPPVRLPTK